MGFFTNVFDLVFRRPASHRGEPVVRVYDPASSPATSQGVGAAATGVPSEGVEVTTGRQVLVAQTEGQPLATTDSTPSLEAVPAMVDAASAIQQAAEAALEAPTTVVEQTTTLAPFHVDTPSDGTTSTESPPTSQESPVKPRRSRRATGPGRRKGTRSRRSAFGATRTS